MRYKKTIAILLLITISLGVNAQKSTPCGFKIPPKPLFKTKFQSVYEAAGIVKNMLDSIQWKENFSLREQNGINNAYATIINRTRWIIYDNDFLENLDAYAYTKWASISVLAHEMGHHYYNHVVSSKGSSIPVELEADFFSGYTLAKYGATLEQSVMAMQTIGTDQATSTHPAKKDRVNAITKGWNEAMKTMGNTTTPPSNPGTTNPTNPTSPNNPNNPGNNYPTDPRNDNSDMDPTTDPSKDPSWIGLTIQSNKTETVLLSDDGKNFQKAEIKANKPFIFKFEIYNYGWLRLPYFNGYRTYKLLHGKDYSILYNRRNKNWTVVEVPE
jgi:hypothetical protein